MESNACAMLRCNPAILVRNAVVTGLAGGAAGGCWAASAIGARRATIANRDGFMREPLGLTEDCYSAREPPFPQIATCNSADELVRYEVSLDHLMRLVCRPAGTHM